MNFLQGVGSRRSTWDTDQLAVVSLFFMSSQVNLFSLRNRQPAFLFLERSAHCCQFAGLLNAPYSEAHPLSLGRAKVYGRT